jgi:hypothetical protein
MASSESGIYPSDSGMYPSYSGMSPSHSRISPSGSGRSCERCNQCAKPAYFFSPASTLRARRFWEGGSGQVAKAVKAQGGL